MKYKRYIYIGLCLCLGLLFTLLSLNSAVSIASMAKDITSAEKTLPNIIIDAGHGGEDGGASTASGVLEKDLNLAISLYLKAFLEQSGFKVTLTRDDDYAIYDEGSNTLREKKQSDLKNRAEICNNDKNNIYISIHQNKFEQSKYKGTQVFYSSNNEVSKPLAEAMQNTVKELIQKDNDRKIKPSNGAIYILDKAQVPCVLIECGFLSNPEEASLLATADYQKQLSFALFLGFLDYYNNSY